MLYIFPGPAFPKTGYHTIRITKDMIYNFQKEFTYIFPECQIAGNRSTTPEEQGKDFERDKTFLPDEKNFRRAIFRSHNFKRWK